MAAPGDHKTWKRLIVACDGMLLLHAGLENTEVS